jgi:hypothetical protein
MGARGDPAGTAAAVRSGAAAIGHVRALDHFTGLWDVPRARPWEEGAGVGVGLAVAVGEVVLVGAAVGPDVATGAVEAVGRTGEEVRCAVGPDLSCAAVELALPAEWPVPDGESEAVARGAARCVVSGCGTNGALMPGPPSMVLISRAT